MRRRLRASRQKLQDGRCRTEGMYACLARHSKTGARVENWVLRAVYPSIRVADGRRSRDTEGEGDGSRKIRTVGQGFKIRRKNSDRA